MNEGDAFTTKKYAPRNGGDNQTEKPAKRPKAKRALEPTDDHIAEAFAEEHRNDLRYVAAWGKWFEWRAGCWREEKTLRPFDLIRETCRAQGHQARRHGEDGRRRPRARPRRPAARRDRRAMGRRPDAAQHPGRRRRPAERRAQPHIDPATT